MDASDKCKQITVKQSMVIYNILGNNNLCNGEWEVAYPTGLHQKIALQFWQLKVSG